MNFKEIADRFKRRPQDVVGIDLSSSGTQVVRIRKNNDHDTVTAVGFFPEIPFPPEEESPQPLTLPTPMKAKYACITIPADGAIVKLLSFPGAFDDSGIDKLVESLGVENVDDYRIGYKIITEGHGKQESRVMGVAVPNTEIEAACAMLPTGLPAPFSIEIAGLATMSSFLHSPLPEIEAEAFAVMDFGPNRTSFAIFNRGNLALFRRFDVGAADVVRKVQSTLGVDHETAHGIISDGAFDISQAVNDVIGPIVKQMVVSRDFVERRENCHVKKLYTAGSLVKSRDSLDVVRSGLGVELDSWNPFDGFTVQESAVPDELQGQEWRFAAATGAVAGMFEDLA